MCEIQILNKNTGNDSLFEMFLLCEYLTKKFWFLDICLNLNVDTHRVIKRLIFLTTIKQKNTRKDTVLAMKKISQV